MDAVRASADLYKKYESYFSLLHGKTEEHKMLSENTYNIDEKSFAIGLVSKSKICYHREAYESKRVTVTL